MLRNKELCLERVGKKLFGTYASRKSFFKNPKIVSRVSGGGITEGDDRHDRMRGFEKGDRNGNSI
jgi:hypothetical protein